MRAESYFIAGGNWWESPTAIDRRNAGTIKTFTSDQEIALRPPSRSSIIAVLNQAQLLVLFEVIIKM